MGSTNFLTGKPNYTISVKKPMMFGAIGGLLLIVFFLMTAGGVQEEWGKYRMIRPLLVVTFAGAMCGLVYYLINPLHYSTTGKKIIALIVTGVICFV